MNEEAEPLVSICCLTYNHEDCIHDAVESFLMQETDFPFEIIIHDDASVDATADIIREYERRYPDIIKPIYQTENQYSKGENVSLIALKAARGRYVTLCEGDDYWIDPLKLQKQIAEMENHPECHISFHPAIQRWVDGSREDALLGLYSDEATIVPAEKVILWWNILMPTAAIVINSSAMPRIISFFETTREVPVGDYYVQVLGAENGGALYLRDIMSVYRYGISGSWSVRLQDNKAHSLFIRSSIAAQDKLNRFTDNKYSELFAIRKRKYYSDAISSPLLDINTKKSIIEGNVNYICIRDRILWNLVFKHSWQRCCMVYVNVHCRSTTAGIEVPL
ncbi:glycosyltransferase [Methanoculleus sp.]|uniref:glycosyltransferase family 2 protein n=1 Tax=Methanoculleus sp. TaxID=90427 RepID=UPI0025D082CD|nr:glycosyltransferase [Methanoculleus sp.]